VKERTKNILGSLAVLAFSLLLCLIGVEIVFRTLLSEARMRPVAWDDRPPFYYVPEGAPTLQDRAHAAVKPPQTFRIAVVGDSFAFGPYMQFDDTFSERLERMLNLNQTALKVEVINYGVPRYSTSHEVGTVERAIREQADLILLQITLNDPEIKPYRPTGLIGGVVDRFGGLEFKEGVLSWWKTGAFVAKRIYNAQSKQRYIQYFADLWEGEKTKQNFLTSYSKIQKLAAAAKTPLAAVVFPLIGLPTDPYSFTKIHEQIRQYSAERQIPELDLFDAYRGIPVDRLQTIVGKDFHPNEIGHRIAAERLYRFLAEQKLLPAEVLIKHEVPERIGIKLAGEEK